MAVPARDDRACFVGGPDGVVDLETESKGVFGLSFDELLGSEWVKDDSICFKVCIEEAIMKDHPSQGLVRVGHHASIYERKPPSVEVPPPTLKARLSLGAVRSMSETPQQPACSASCMGSAAVRLTSSSSACPHTVASGDIVTAWRGGRAG